MIVRMGILRKKENLTVQAFHKHWLEVHAPIAIKIPGVHRYHQNHVVDSTQLGINYPGESQTVDGISQLLFDDLQSMQLSSTSETIKMLNEDEVRFIGSWQLILAKQDVVIPTPDDKRLIKKMSLLERRPDVDPEMFQREWTEVHAELVRSMQGVKGYTQNIVFDRNVGQGRSIQNKIVPIEGIVELWFPDISSLEVAFGLPCWAEGNFTYENFH